MTPPGRLEDNAAVEAAVMPILYLLLLIVVMCVGGMLIHYNPEPLTFGFWFFGEWRSSSSILEIIGYSALLGAGVVAIGHVRSLWLHRRERLAMEREAEALRRHNATLHREAENAITTTKLLEARVAEVEERYAQLEAQARPLLTMSPDLTPEEPPAEGQPRRPRRRRPVRSRWRRK